MNFFNDYSVWDFKKRFEKDKVCFSLHGHAVAAKKSGFYIPEWKLMLDAGIQSLYSPQTICITHLHSDHAFALPMIVKNIDTVPNVYVPVGCAPLADNFVVALETMSHDGNLLSDHRVYCLMEAQVGIPFFLNNVGTIKVLPLQTFHSVRSVGYCFFETRKRLKAEFSNRTKEELAELARTKISLNESYEKPLFVYTGDTSIKVFDQKLFQECTFPFIITECTFISDLEPTPEKAQELIARAEEYGHVDFSLLRDFVLNQPCFKNTTFILTHFSSRYVLVDVQAFMKTQPLDIQEKVFIWPN